MAVRSFRNAYSAMEAGQRDVHATHYGDRSVPY
jgi:hypothetical protein